MGYEETRRGQRGPCRRFASKSALPGTRIPDAAAFAATCRGALRTAWDQLALPANEFAEEDAASLPDQLHGFPIILSDVFSLVNSDYILVVWPCPNSQLFAFSLSFFCPYFSVSFLLPSLFSFICVVTFATKLRPSYRISIERLCYAILSICFLYVDSLLVCVGRSKHRVFDLQAAPFLRRVARSSWEKRVKRGNLLSRIGSRGFAVISREDGVSFAGVQARVAEV